VHKNLPLVIILIHMNLVTLHYIAFHYVPFHLFIHLFDATLSPSSNTMWNKLYRYIKIHNTKYKVL